jgi:hypothetical protein
MKNANGKNYMLTTPKGDSGLKRSNNNSGINNTPIVNLGHRHLNTQNPKCATFKNIDETKVL